jgi:hypothetical protein
MPVLPVRPIEEAAMGTVALTEKTFEKTGALPASALADLIAQLRTLDMDEVRAAVAQQHTSA